MGRSPPTGSSDLEITTSQGTVGLASFCPVTVVEARSRVTMLAAAGGPEGEAGGGVSSVQAVVATSSAAIAALRNFSILFPFPAEPGFVLAAMLRRWESVPARSLSR